MPLDRSPFLNLPEAVQREVISWSPDGSTANALLAACRLTQQQRRDPATAALLLLRCPCRDYVAALSSSAKSCGGLRAVVQQVVQLMGACPDSGGPLAAPPPLLQMVLCAAVVCPDPDTLRSLLALRQPPDVNGCAGQAAGLAIQRCWRTGQVVALQTLLDCGADPCVGDMRLFYHAAEQPSTLPALQLLLQHCPAGAQPAALVAAAASAMDSRNVITLEHLLMLPGTVASLTPAQLLTRAADVGLPAALQLVIDRTTCSPNDLAKGLIVSANRGHCACATLLLDGGAGANNVASLALECAFARSIQQRQVVVEGPAQPGVDAVQGMVGLLLRRGGVATPEVRAAAEAAGHTALLARVMAEVAAEAADGDA